MRAEVMAAYTRSILELLVARMAEQEATIRDQAERLGRQVAKLERAVSIAVKLSDELDAARARISTLEASTAAQVVEPSRPPWRAWWLWLGLLAPILATAIVVVLLVAR